MPRLTFGPVPPGPTPLFIGDPCDDISSQGRLICDHAAKMVRWEAADPFECTPNNGPSTLNRYSAWEVDALMPRRQILGLYAEVKPLLERFDASLTIRLVEGGWARTASVEADTLNLLIDETLNVEADAPVAWAPLRVEAKPDISIADLRRAGFSEHANRMIGNIASHLAPMISAADLHAAMASRLKANTIEATALRGLKPTRAAIEAGQIHASLLRGADLDLQRKALLASIEGPPLLRRAPGAPRSSPE